jgi:THO complex subunit 1
MVDEPAGASFNHLAQTQAAARTQSNSKMALESVAAYRNIIEPYLDHPEDDHAGLIDQLRHQNEAGSSQGQPAQFAAIETVFRDKFYELLATTEIFDVAFDSVWHLLDVVSILSDKELCESGLIFWLIEELLDSQTIDGCRKVFDYLESRRERITSKHFKQKQLIILRCCNELLRRLSRAEDIVFCGRVFIFLFQSFPLGDKSSVNLRGEYHVENVTIFDAEHKKSEDAIKPMELNSKDGAQEVSEAGTPAVSGVDTADGQTPSKTTSKAPPSNTAELQPDLDALYPQFWDLQSYCSAPTRLFDANNLKPFKEGIAATMACFQQMGAHSAPSNRQEESKRGIKRKRSETGNEIASTFNPKYLTNRDLFDLEVHDIAFRRHILVQILILLDFLLSLTQSAKAKLAELTNKSVLYAYTLSPEDAEWATSTKASITSYLQQGSSNEGKFYYRMVDTVLSRDKNWVRWKAENCPPIDRPSVDVQQYVDAQKALEKLCIRKPLPTPPGAGDLEFLSETAPIESLKDPSRYKVPSMQKFYDDIMRIELDQEMATEEEKQDLEEAKERTLWRALRASQHRFTLCEKIENGKNLCALLGDNIKNENVAPEETGIENEA